MSFISEVFYENITKHKNVAIYGIGEITKVFLERYGNKLNIIGLLDGFRCVGKMYDHEIISLEEAALRDAEIIIIAARPASLKIVFNKISIFCRLHEIMIFDVNGNDLFKIYDYDRATEKKEYITDFEFGYRFYAPVAAQFIMWLVNHFVNSNYDYVLFLSRDGYIFKKMYDKVRESFNMRLPKSVYFKTSRTVCGISVSYSIVNAEYFAKFAYDGTPEQLLKNRFFLDESEIKPFNLENYKTIEEYVLQHFEKIKEQANIHKQQYCEYINRTFPDILDKNKKIAFFDLVSTGTCQMCLQEIMGREIDGYYFARINENFTKKKKLNITSMYNENDSILEHYFWIELISKEPIPSLLCFSSSGEPIYKEDTKDIQTLQTIQDVQEGALSYFNENFSKFCANGDMEQIIVPSITNISCSLFENVVTMDEFTGRILDLKLMK